MRRGICQQSPPSYNLRFILWRTSGWDIGVTGGMDSGKSTFVSAIRGLGDEDPNSACTGVVEMTVDPTPYPHPKYPSVVFWDLPGVGTPTFRADKYFQRVQLFQYDFFLIITSESFTTDLAELALEILRRGKHFYCVRSKVDVDIAASRSRRPSSFSEERVLNQIRDDCAQRLEGEGQALGGWVIIYLFWTHHAACRILVPRTGIELPPLAAKALSPNHWTAWKFLSILFLIILFIHRLGGGLDS